MGSLRNPGLLSRTLRFTAGLRPLAGALLFLLDQLQQPLLRHRAFFRCEGSFTGRYDRQVFGLDWGHWNAPALFLMAVRILHFGSQVAKRPATTQTTDSICLGCLRLQGAYDTRPQATEGRGQGVGYSLLPGT